MERLGFSGRYLEYRFTDRQSGWTSGGISVEKDGCGVCSGNSVERSGCRQRFKLFWMGSKAKTDGVGIFVAEKWVDSVVSIERHSERVLVLKMVLGDCLLKVFTVYASHSGKPSEQKERF